MVRDVEVAEPALLVLELQPPIEVEAAEDDRPERELRERGEQRECSGGPARKRQQPDDEGGCERENDQCGRHCTEMNTTTRTATAAAMASA